MKKIPIILLALFMIASIASAQHHGGPPPMGEHGPEDHGMRGPGGGPGGAVVGSDGTIYVSKVTVDTTAQTASMTITAVRPAGTVAWTKTLAFGAHLILSDGNLIAESGTHNADDTFTTTLTAISTATGATAWTKTLNGHVELRPFNGGTYAIVTIPPTTAGGTPTRSLVGIGNDGSTLFTLAL